MRISEPSFTSAQLNFVQDFLTKPGFRYVYGRTQEAASIAKHVDIDGYIDDFTKDETFDGLPCLRLDDVPASARIISTVIQAFANAAIEKLQARKLSFIDYFAFKAISGLPLREIPYWIGANEHFQANRSAYSRLYEKLADEESRTTFEHVLNFRLNHDLGEMKSFKANLKGMYFEPFLTVPRKGAVFFDIGSFDGYNSQHFAELYPEMDLAILFEPIPMQARELEEKFKDKAKFRVFDLAISDGDGQVMFSVNSTASHLSKDGSGISVKTARLDSFCTSHELIPDMIKMDIEGSELLALNGATKTIQKNRPNLAISVYHNASHLTDAFSLIDGLNPAYKYYLRHYTEGYTETVLFAVPGF
jgi:FkbM family methyltransferase